ncbi:MAG: aminotransferase class IV [Candidatus Hydrothermia bacterium]
MTQKRVYFIDGKFKRNAVSNIEDRGLFFADSIYEVIRAINNVPLFLNDHLERMYNGLKELKIEAPYSKEELTGIILKSLQKLHADDALVYIQITRGKEPRSHLPRKNTKPTIVMITSKFRPLSPKLHKSGVPLKFYPDIRWARCDIKTTMLLPNVLAKMEAKEQGFFDALFVKNGKITESTSSSFFGVIGETVYTHPITHEILPSITRKVVIDICKNLRIPIKEEPIPINSIKNLTGAFLAGTTYDILAVSRIEDAEIPHSEIVKSIQEEYIRTIKEIARSHITVRK